MSENGSGSAIVSGVNKGGILLVIAFSFLAGVNWWIVRDSASCLKLHINDQVKAESVQKERDSQQDNQNANALTMYAESIARVEENTENLQRSVSRIEDLLLRK
jgi:hypothetical protein